MRRNVIVVRSSGVIDSTISLLFALVFWSVLFVVMASKLHDAKLAIAADTNTSNGSTHITSKE